MAKEYRYRWTHLPSGVAGVRPFNHCQDPIFLNPELVSTGRAKTVIDRLLWQWNQAHPDTWRYEALPAHLGAGS